MTNFSSPHSRVHVQMCPFLLDMLYNHNFKKGNVSVNVSYVMLNLKFLHVFYLILRKQKNSMIHFH